MGTLASDDVCNSYQTVQLSSFRNNRVDQVTTCIPGDTAKSCSSYNNSEFFHRRITSHTSDMLGFDSVGHYDNFHTIDWQRDLLRDRIRNRRICEKSEINFLGRIMKLIDASSGWFCVLLIGVFSGFFAGIIDIGTRWMEGFRLGVCLDNLWLNRHQCCWSSNNTLSNVQLCDNWYSWSRLFGLENANVTLETSTNNTASHFTSYLLLYFFYVMTALVYAILAVNLVRTFAPYACGSGIPEIKTILSGFIIRGYLGTWTLLIKSITIMLAVSAGLSLGKEGPLVHIACCLGNVLVRLFPKYGRNEAKKREMLSASAASGVAVAFGAPIGGILFSLEEASYYFPLKTLWRSFFCALVSVFIIGFINPFGNEHTVLFYVQHVRSWMAFELVPFILLGAIGGVLGATFVRLNLWICTWRRFSCLSRHSFFEIIALTLFTAFVSFPSPLSRMPGAELINILFNGCETKEAFNLLCQQAIVTDQFDNYSTPLFNHESNSSVFSFVGVPQLIIVFFIKFALTVFTFGIKLPAGLFIPSLAMGALIGRAFGVLMQKATVNYPDWWFFHECLAISANHDCVTVGLYSIVGACAMLAGVTRMTVSLVVIMVELTGSVRYIVPIMLACMMAKWVGDAIVSKGIYVGHIRLNSYPFLDTKRSFSATSCALNVMCPKGDDQFHVFHMNSMSLRQILVMLNNSPHTGYPIILSQESQYLVGFVLRKDLQTAIARSGLNVDDYSDHICVFGDDEYNESIHPASAVTRLSPSHTSRSDSTSSITRLDFTHVVDVAPSTVSDCTSLETVIDMFRKLGLRHILVTHKGRLLGIITKKDILRYLD